MTYPAKVAALGATAYYRLGEASGTTINDEIGTADGTYVNTPDLAQTGAIRDGDTAVNFKSASTERGTLTTLGTFGSHLGTCSVAFWVKTTATVASGTLVGCNNAGTATALQINTNLNTAGATTSKATRFLIRNEAGTSTQCHITTDFYDGNWHFVVGVTDGTVGWKVYVDGVAVTTSSGSGTASGTYANFAVAVDIAARNVNGTHGVYLNGSLDEVAFFPSRLTADDVINLYFEGATRADFTPTASGAYYSAVQALTPALYWRLDETATSYYAKDSSGNGHDGFYLGPDIAAGNAGFVDSDKSVRLTNEAGTGLVRALDYSPFVQDGQVTVTGISQWDDVLNSPAGFQNFFSCYDAQGPVLEGGLQFAANPAPPDVVVRWYGTIVLGYGLDFYPGSPQQGSSRRFHWAFTYDDATIDAHLYIDGVDVIPHNLNLGGAIAFSKSYNGFQVGKRSDSTITNTENWQGEHDEIAVFERLLTQTEIRTLTAAANIAAFDSGSATVSITATGSGVYGYAPDSRSVTAAATPTRTESLAGMDTRSIGIPITLSSSESWTHFPDIAFDDAGSVTVNLTPTRAEAFERLASGPGTVAITPTGAEVYGFVGAATATVGVTPTGSGNYGYTGAQSVSVALTPTATEGIAIADAGTVTVPVTLTGSHPGFQDFGSVTVVISPLGTPYEDSGTATVAITLTGSELTASFDLEGLFGSEPGHLERDEVGHLEFATAGRID